MPLINLEVFIRVLLWIVNIHLTAVYAVAFSNLGGLWCRISSLTPERHQWTSRRASTSSYLCFFQYSFGCACQGLLWSLLMVKTLRNLAVLSCICRSLGFGRVGRHTRCCTCVRMFSGVFKYLSSQVKKESCTRFFALVWTLWHWTLPRQLPILK